MKLNHICLLVYVAALRVGAISPTSSSAQLELSPHNEAGKSQGISVHEESVLLQDNEDGGQTGSLSFYHAAQQRMHAWIRPLSLAAVLTTIALQASGMPSSFEIRKDRDVKRYDGYPYFTVLAMGVQWCIYGTCGALRGETTLLTMVEANLPGVVFGIFYCSNYLSFVPSGDERCKALKGYLKGLATLMVLEIIAFMCTPDRAVFYFGMIGSTFSAQVGVSPFKTLPEVLRTKSTRSWPLDLCFWNMVQSLATGGFGLANNDPWVLVPNVLGVIAAGVQFFLIALFWEQSSNESFAKKTDLENTVRIEPVPAEKMSIV